MKPFSGRKSLLLCAIVAIFLVADDASACSCSTYGEPRKDAKEYYGKKFDGAIFTGTIKEIKHDPKAASGGITFSELSIEVDQYWFGITKPIVVVRTIGPNTTCSVDWKVGEKDFFIASNHNHHLYRSMCDLANWGGSFPDSEWTKYTTETLGPWKSFLKKDRKP